MKKLSKTIVLFIVAILFLAACSGETEEETSEAEQNETEQTEVEVEDESQADEEVIQLAESFVEKVHEGKYEEATEMFDDTMREQLGTEELEELWESLEEQLGEFIDYEYYRTETVEGYEVILINGVFNDADTTFQVTVDDNQKIAGFYIQ